MYKFQNGTYISAQNALDQDENEGLVIGRTPMKVLIAPILIIGLINGKTFSRLLSVVKDATKAIGIM